MDAASTPAVATAAADETWISITFTVFLWLCVYIPLISAVVIIWWFGGIAAFLTAFYMPICIVSGRAAKWNTTKQSDGSYALHGVDIYGEGDPKWVRKFYTLIFAGCFVLFPCMITPFCLEDRDLWGEESWPAYPKAFQTAWRAWLVLWMAYAAIWAGIIVSMIVDGFFAQSRRAAGAIEQLRKDKIDASSNWPYSHRHWISVVATLLFFLLTAWNIIIYASRYGIFTRHGDFNDFVYCYLYSTGLILSGFELIVATFGTCLGGFFAIWLACALMLDFLHSRGILTQKNDGKAKRRTLSQEWGTDWNLAQWTVITFVAWCFAVGSFKVFFYKTGCGHMRSRLNELVEKALKPGNEDMMLTWGLIINSTSTYNVTMEPYRPYNPYADPAHYKYEPVMIEYGCEIIAGLKWTRSAVYAMAAVVVYLGAQLVRQRRALSQANDKLWLKA